MHKWLADFRTETKYCGLGGEEWQKHLKTLGDLPGDERTRAAKARRKLHWKACSARQTNEWLEGIQLARALQEFFVGMTTQEDLMKADGDSSRRIILDEFQNRFLACNKHLLVWFGS